MSWRFIEGGGVRDVPGFRVAGVASGVRKRRRDLALLVSDAPASVGATFTTNVVAAAPVGVSKRHAALGTARAIVVNAGIANACTGERGLQDAERMCEVTGDALGVAAREVLVASTGVIGQPLPMDLVEAGIRDAAVRLGETPAGSVAEAIMTTDLVPKEVLAEAEVAGTTVRIGGVAKGSGMIHPNMATMLAFILTDTAVEPGALQALTRRIVDRTFNMISVDGDTSTNDMVLVLANGRAGHPPLQEGDAGFAELEDALEGVLRDLAIRIARDGEGATTLLEVVVKGAASPEDARKIARTVASSSLVKSAVFGRDPNWGRVLAAAGRSGATFDPSRVSLDLGTPTARARVLRDGQPCEGLDRQLLTSLLQPPHVIFTLHLHAGAHDATAWGCDLTYDYVKINAEYTT